MSYYKQAHTHCHKSLQNGENRKSDDTPTCILMHGSGQIGEHTHARKYTHKRTETWKELLEVAQLSREDMDYLTYCWSCWRAYGVAFRADMRPFADAYSRARQWFLNRPMDWWFPKIQWGRQYIQDAYDKRSYENINTSILPWHLHLVSVCMKM